MNFVIETTDLLSILNKMKINCRKKKKSCNLVVTNFYCRIIFDTMKRKLHTNEN